MVKVDMDQLAVFMRFKPTQKDCADYFKVSEDIIAYRIKNATGLTFSEFRDQNMVHTRFSLVQEAIRKAQKGDNTMLIFCLKNLCGWKDRYESEDVVTNNIQIKIDATDAKL